MVLNTKETQRFRAEAVEGMAGNVLEVGFGSGLNASLYPPEVTRVLAVEPSPVARRLSARWTQSSPVPVEFVGHDAQELPLPSCSADAALSTFTLCTIPDAPRALDELMRVLKPGGTFHFVEHGLSPLAATARWQRRLSPLQRRIAAGCHLDRPIDSLVRAAGFEVTRLRNDEMSGPRPLKPFSYLYIGTATKPATP